MKKSGEKPLIGLRRRFWAPTRRAFMIAGAAAGLTAGCATAYPPQVAQRRWPPLGDVVRAGGLDIHLWDRGETGPPVIMIHGASGNLRDWTYSIAPKIAQTRRVVAMDRPGFGYSSRPAENGWDPRVQAKALAAAADAVGVERPIVVGHSWGAAVAMAWALQRPDDVVGVVAVSGVVMPYEGAARVVGALGIDQLVVSLYAEFLKSSAEDGGIDRFVARVFRPQSPPPGYVDYVGGPLALREATLNANIEDIANLNRALSEMAPAYPSLKTPVEILHGEADFISLERQAGRLVETLPNARLTRLDGVGHMAHHIRTDALIDAIDRLAGSDIVKA